MSRTCVVPSRLKFEEQIKTVPRKPQVKAGCNKLLALTVLIFIFGVGIGIGIMRMIVGESRSTPQGPEIPIDSLKEDLATMVRALGDMEAKHDQLCAEIYNEKLSIAAYIDEALKKYDADKTGLIDYALESGGGAIAAVLGTTNYGTTSALPILGKRAMYNPPEVVLRPGSQPGQCFAFTGSEGRIRIRLILPIAVTAVTVEHVPFDIAHDLRSAPRDFAVYALKDADAHIGYFLGKFQFDVDHAKSLQTFYMPTLGAPQEIRRLQFIELHFMSNHGHPKYTCVYRIRVHGNE